jgi:hypothetical protein
VFVDDLDDAQLYLARRSIGLGVEFDKIALGLHVDLRVDVCSPLWISRESKNLDRHSQVARDD